MTDDDALCRTVEIARARGRHTLASHIAELRFDDGIDTRETPLPAPRQDQSVFDHERDGRPSEPPDGV